MNIKEAAAKFDLTADTLRYYERIGVIPPVTRNDSGYRDYQVRVRFLVVNVCKYINSCQLTVIAFLIIEECDFLVEMLK